MTPCGEKGYEVGQVFEDEDGEIIVLHIDDGSDQPCWVSMISDTTSCHWPDIKGSCAIPVHRVNRIYPPEELPSKVTITCEGKKVEISRESAEALNLI